MYTKKERYVIADTIVKQMGGMKIRAMVNARDFLVLDAGVQFTFSGKRGMNKCVVKLNGMDTYDVEFWYVNARKGTCDLKESFDDVYEDMLIDIFEHTTGLYLSL